MEVVEYSLEMKKDAKNETTNDIMKELKHGCVSTNSKKNYISNIILLIIYIYKFDRYLLHNSWSATLDAFTKNIDDEKKKDVAMKRTIKKLVDMGKEEAPPLDFAKYSPQHFIKYLLSLRSVEDRRLSLASYAMKRSSLFHLFRL